MDAKILLKALPFELERTIASHVNRLFKRRPSSKPFLSGDTFRHYADILYDETRICKAEDIHKNDVIFIKADMLLTFAETILPQVKNRFILITHQSDMTIDNSYKYIADNPLIVHWFAQNCLLAHPKITPLPIGLENTCRHNAGYVFDFKKLYRKQQQCNKIKKAKVVIAFNMSTNPDKRFVCYRSFWRKPSGIEFPSVFTCRQYRRELTKYMFVASPDGNGLDCHRTWEAMYLNVIPLVENNQMNQYFASLGLPLLLVDDWNIPAQWTVAEMNEIYNSVMKNKKLDVAFFPFWEEKIHAYKK